MSHRPGECFLASISTLAELDSLRHGETILMLRVLVPSLAR